MDTKQQPVQIEVCIEEASCAEDIVSAGANRIELCSALDLDGLTPTAQALQKTCQAGVPVTAMTRIRGGDFVLDENDVSRMRDEISAHIEAGASGIVIGALTRDGAIDTVSMRWLVDSCAGRPVTFHRAFDHCVDRVTGLEQVIDCGCQRLLTSGGAATANQGIEEISRIVEAATGRLEVIAGGGVRPGSAFNLVEKTGVQWLHLSARRKVSGQMQNCPPQFSVEPTTSLDPGQRWITDPAIIRALREELSRGVG